MSYDNAPVSVRSVEQRIRNLEGTERLALRRRVSMALVVVGQMLPEGAIKGYTTLGGHYLSASTGSGADRICDAGVWCRDWCQGGLGGERRRRLPQVASDLRLHPEPRSRIRLRQERQRLIAVGARSVPHAVRPRVTGLPAPKAALANCPSLRVWTLRSASLWCSSCPPAVSKRRKRTGVPFRATQVHEPRKSAESRGSLSVRAPSCGTVWHALNDTSVPFPGPRAIPPAPDRCVRAPAMPLGTGICSHRCPPLSVGRGHGRGPEPQKNAVPGLSTTRVARLWPPRGIRTSQKSQSSSWVSTISPMT
jgi:hypothetical protein